MPDTGKATVLIVDDITENIDVLSGVLQGEYKVKAAVNGKMAIKIATTQDPPPDVILLDIMMPEMDGYEVCSWLKDDIRTKNVPVIFVTAKNEIVDEEKGFQVGAVDYITKPISPPIVLARVKAQLQLYNQQRHLTALVDEKTAEIQHTRLEVIRRLGRAAEFKDDDTGLHVIRMSRYCQEIALTYGLEPDDANLILNAAPMHDVGKIGIPDNILQKPGKLDDEEWVVMRKHPQMGSDIIGKHKGELLSNAATCALTHHEKWNGKGYPKGLEGEEIPLIGRIVAIADVFDALTSDRPYKKAWPMEKTLSVIEEEKGEQFDPEIVDAFFAALPKIEEIKTKLAETPG